MELLILDHCAWKIGFVPFGFFWEQEPVEMEGPGGLFLLLIMAPLYCLIFRRAWERWHPPEFSHHQCPPTGPGQTLSLTGLKIDKNKLKTNWYCWLYIPTYKEKDTKGLFWLASLLMLVPTGSFFVENILSERLGQII